MYQDTFLKPELFKNLVYKINKSCKLAKDNTVPSRKLEIMRNKFKYITTFESKGVQGIVGILEHRETQTQIIFKLSIDIDRGVEHENKVTLQLNKLRDFCPNFVGNLGCVELPISRTYTYVNTPEDSDYEDSEEDEDESKKEDSEDEENYESDSDSEINSEVEPE